MATKKAQSLAEHSFNVAQIARAILTELNMVADWGGKVALLALDHDIDEVITGDIPTPAKDSYYDFSGPISPEDIVKIADIVDAWTFIKANKIDRHGEHVASYVHGIYNQMLDDLPVHMVGAIAKVVTDIMEGEFTI